MKTGVILARFQPIHNGHIELIRQAVSENSQVLILIGSADKLNERNPIPWNIRYELVKNALKEEFTGDEYNKIKLTTLPDLTDESDNSHDWGFYLYSTVVREMGTGEFTMYYSDGFEIITSWFPGFLLRNSVSLSLLARNACEGGVSATQVREMVLNDRLPEKGVVPTVYMNDARLSKRFSMYSENKHESVRMSMYCVW